MRIPFRLEFEKWEDGTRIVKQLEAPNRWEVHSAERVAVSIGSLQLIALQKPFSLRGSKIGVGACLWDGALVLTAYLLSQPLYRYVGMRCIELGAGVGCVSVALAKLGARVVATDLAKVLPLLRENIEVNEVSSRKTAVGGGWVQAEELEWGALGWENRVSALSEPPFDMVLAADCCYIDGDGRSPSTPAFVEACAALCGPDTRVLVASERRASEVRECFLEEATRRFRSVRSIPSAQVPVPFRLEYCDLWELRL